MLGNAPPICMAIGRPFVSLAKGRLTHALTEPGIGRRNTILVTLNVIVTEIEITMTQFVVWNCSKVTVFKSAELP